MTHQRAQHAAPLRTGAHDQRSPVWESARRKASGLKTRATLIQPQIQRSRRDAGATNGGPRQRTRRCQVLVPGAACCAPTKTGRELRKRFRRAERWYARARRGGRRADGHRLKAPGLKTHSCVRVNPGYMKSEKGRRAGVATSEPAAMGAALPSTCAGRSMLRPYETGSRAAQKVSACGEMVRASKARRQKSRPAQIKSPGLYGMLANA
jgi:hypothetical protein